MCCCSPAGLPCPAGRCGHHPPTALQSDGGGQAPWEARKPEQRRDLQRGEGGFQKGLLSQNSLSCSHGHSRGRAGLWGGGRLCCITGPLSFLGVEREVGLWEVRAMCVPLLGVPLCWYFLTLPLTSTGVWGPKELRPSGHSGRPPTGRQAQHGELLAAFLGMPSVGRRFGLRR